MSNIVKFTNTATTVKEALESAIQADYEDVLILGYDSEGDLRIAYSQMTNKDVLWLLKNAEKEVV